MQIVNGYVCQNCTDVDKAKRYIDPAQPPPGRASDDTKKDQKGTIAPEAVTFGGTLSKPPESRRDKDPAERERRPGDQVNVSA
jgi:hypothetical protein